MHNSEVLDTVVYNKAAAVHHGKIRESFMFENGTRAIVVTDRISAFDFVLGTVPKKGQVLNQIAAWWFGKLDSINIPHHLISVPHPNVSLVKTVKPLPLEFIVRGYLTGTTTTSSWYAYNNHDRMICGLEMPAGMHKNQPFPEIMVTPSTKPETGHDKNVSLAEILELNLATPDILDKAVEYAKKMFKYGQSEAAKQGLILVDTKYEMGLTSDGELIVIDEVHTPDSSRYWVADSYEARINMGQEPDMLDKEFVRRMVVNNGYDVDSDENPADYFTTEIQQAASQKYLELYTRMTGNKFDLHQSSHPEHIIKILDQCV